MKLRRSLTQDHSDEQENDELWAISYGDMITLLLSFFVIYFSIDPKKDELDKIDNHLITSFKMLELKNDKVAPPTLLNKEVKIIADAPKFKDIQNAKITKLDDRLLVTFDQMSFFETGVVEPNKTGEVSLKNFAQNYLPYSSMYKVGVKAFTDKTTVSNRHRYKDNMELSALRALAAMRVLQRAGIPLNRMEISGYGEMTQLHSLMQEDKLKKLSDTEIKNISRTLVLIIKHDNEQSVL